MGQLRTVAAAVLGLAIGAAHAQVAWGQCVGDCNGDGMVAINELIVGVNIALGLQPVSTCQAFADGQGQVNVAQLIRGVNNALNGCAPDVTPTSTATLAVSTATSTVLAGTVTATATSPPPATDTPPLVDTPTPTATFTATATPGGEPTAVCGNGLLEPGETCEACAADCAVGACTATGTTVTIAVSFAGAPGTSPTTATTLIGYRSTRVSVPGAGNAQTVRQRITYPAPLPNVASPNDLDYALRVVLGRNAGLSDGLLYSVQFDTCQGGGAVTAADFACTMEGCAGAGGPITGCTCSVALP